MQTSEDLGNTFERSWQLLTNNWIIIVPAIVIAVIAAIIVTLLATFGFASVVGFGAVGMGGAGLGAALLTGIILGLVVLIASIVTVAYTTGMAEAAWRTGTATLADGAAAFREDAGSLFTAIVLLFILGIIAVVLAPFTFLLSLLAYWLFFIYTFASVVVGKRSGMEALGDSARLTSRNFVMTLAIVILLCIAFFIAGWIGGILHHIVFVGPIVSYIINQAVAAFATLVIVGEYIKLRAAQPVGVGTPPTASPPPSV
jgi:uncharacterized membrane protein